MSSKLPYLVAVTGSIGMGKSETARMFARLGIPVFDADAAVHALYEPGGAAVAPIAQAFPGTVNEDRVDRAPLAVALQAEPDGYARLEQIVHPLVRAEQQRFVAEAAAGGADIVVLDIPLLFETGRHQDVDAVVVVSAPTDVQRARVLLRAGMTPQKLDHLLARQMSDVDKRAQAHFVIETDQGFDHAFEQVKHIVAILRERLKQEHPVA